MSAGYIVLIIFGFIIYTIIMTAIICGVFFSKYEYFWVTPHGLMENQTSLNLFGRWLVSIIVWLINPGAAIIAFIYWICTVGGKKPDDNN